VAEDGHLLESSALFSVKGQAEFTVCLVFENAAMRKLFGRKGEEVTGLETRSLLICTPYQILLKL